MFRELRGIIAGFADSNLRALLEAVSSAIRTWPALQNGARRQKHSSCLPRRPDRARSFAVRAEPRWSGRHYPQIDVDLLTTGAILHDIGKNRRTFLRSAASATAPKANCSVTSSLGLRLLQQDFRTAARFSAPAAHARRAHGHQPPRRAGVRFAEGTACSPKRCCCIISTISIRRWTRCAARLQTRSGRSRASSRLDCAARNACLLKKEYYLHPSARPRSTPAPPAPIAGAETQARPPPPPSVRRKTASRARIAKIALNVTIGSCQAPGFVQRAAANPARSGRKQR